MLLNHGLHLAYCTNVHPGEDWSQTLEALNHHTLVVKERLARPRPFAIGLRLSDLASRELAQGNTLRQFQHWLERHDCYVFTINGFPFGRFHGGRVKEQVYRPDWTDPARLEYTNRLFHLLAELLPPGIEGSVSTLPGSFKEFIHAPEQERQIRDNLWRCVEHVAQLSERCGRRLHLGVEPEPLGWFENSFETVRFFEQLRAEHPRDPRLNEHLGVNYDTCHFAVEFESAADALARLREHGIRLSKIHLSNALKLRPTPDCLRQLAEFADPVYLHQVIVRGGRPGEADPALVRYKDLDLALAAAPTTAGADHCEWRVHFHIPLHGELPAGFETTAAHVVELIKLLSVEPALCSHLEMETYTWAVLPKALRTRDVADQLVGEYRWTLDQLARYGLGEPTNSNTKGL